MAFGSDSVMPKVKLPPKTHLKTPNLILKLPFADNSSVKLPKNSPRNSPETITKNSLENFPKTPLKTLNLV